MKREVLMKIGPRRADFEHRLSTEWCNSRPYHHPIRRPSTKKFPYFPFPFLSPSRLVFLHTILLITSGESIETIDHWSPEDTVSGWWFQICRRPRPNQVLTSAGKARCFLTEVEQMSTSAPCSCAGYVVPNSDSDLIDLHVLRLNGEGFMLKVSSCSLGCEVHRLVSKQFQPKKGEQLTLQYLGAQLMLHQTLQEQGIVGKEETLSCTSVPTDLYAAYCFIQRQGSPVPEGEFVLQGITQIVGAPTVQFDLLPQTLEMLSFGGRFNQSLEGVNLPSNLQSLTFGHDFNQSLEGVNLPRNIQSLTFGWWFNKSLEGVNLPSNLQSLTFGDDFNQSLEGVNLPSNLQSLTFGWCFNQSLEGVNLPSNLQSLTFGRDFN